MSTLGSATCARCTAFVPMFGSWRAEGVLDGGAVPTVGPGQVLTLGDLILTGTVVRAADDAPDRPHFVMVGGAGWETPLPAPITYQQDLGVRLSTVLRDLAVLTRLTPTDPSTGETVELPADRVIGTAYASPAPRAGQFLRVRDALAALVRAGVLQPWRVDPDGVTRFGPRAGMLVPAATRQTLLRRDAGVGVALLGVEGPAAFLPGNACQALDGAVVRRLVVMETAGALEVEVWGGPGRPAPPVRNAVRRMVREDFPELAYAYPRTYVVQAVRSDGRIDLVPPADAPELPALPAVDQWLAAIAVTPNVGDQVVVQFRDANPTRPMIVQVMPLRATSPTAVAVGGTSVAVLVGGEVGRPVRYGDPVSIPVVGSLATGAVSLPAPGANLSRVKA